MKLIAIEGTDSSGKATQSKLLCENLQKLGYKATVISFPNYGTPSCSLVENYLSGKFEQELEPKTISMFYAIDRMVKMQTLKKELTEKNYDYVIFDRYVMSNAVHQGLAYEGKEKTDFLNWITTIEYEMLGIPKEDLTIFIDMPLEFSLMLLEKRVGKEGVQHDIHENRGHLTKAYKNAKFIAGYYNWDTVTCVNNMDKVDMSSIKKREEIAEEILQLVLGKESANNE